MAILGPEIAKRRRLISRAASAAAAADPSAVGATDPSANSAPEAPVDGAAPDELSEERRQSERRRITSGRMTGPDRRSTEPRRDGADRRATQLERERRLTPAGRHAISLITAAGDQPVALTGETGLLTALVSDILQRGLEVEIAAHLGHERWESGARGAENIRNGAYPKRVLTDLGVIRVAMPRDRRGSFEPLIVPKHGRRLPAPAANIATVYASGMTRAEIRSQLDHITLSRLDREVVERFTSEMEPEIRAWQRRHFESSYPVLLVDSITLSGRGARTTKRSLDVALAIDAYGDAELLGLWRRPSRAAEDVDRWSPMLDELHYRGISAVEFICGAGDASLTAAAERVFPLAKVRPGVEALVQNALRAEE